VRTPEEVLRRLVSTDGKRPRAEQNAQGDAVSDVLHLRPPWPIVCACPPLSFAAIYGGRQKRDVAVPKPAGSTGRKMAGESRGPSTACAGPSLKRRRRELCGEAPLEAEPEANASLVKFPSGMFLQEIPLILALKLATELKHVTRQGC
jgi:hypothetical protein